MSTPRDTVILVPVHRYVEPACDESLRKAEKAGYTVIRYYGSSAIDLARNHLAQQALHMSFKGIIWVDADIEFTMKDLEALQASNRPVVSGLYPVKGTTRLSGRIKAKSRDEFELINTGCGFLYTSSEVYRQIVEICKLSQCDCRGSRFYPWFMPFEKDGVYYPEDSAFCYRLKQAGYKIIGLNKVRVKHIGSHKYEYNPELVTSPGTLALPCTPGPSLESRQELIDATAANSLGVSYRKVWSSITEIPRSLLSSDKATAYNPSIVKHLDETWMFYRHEKQPADYHPKWNSAREITVHAVRLDANYSPDPATDHEVLISNTWKSGCFEDPKASSDGKNVWLTVVEPDYQETEKQNRWVSGLKVATLQYENGRFSESSSGQPRFGNNPGMEKNWTMFFNEGKNLVNYSMNPHVVFNLDDFKDRHNSPGVSWSLGEATHGGTPPVLVDGLFYSFYHGKYKHRKLAGTPTAYMMGCLAFSPAAPYRVVKHTRTPLMWSDLTPGERPISCLFPAGALFDKEKSEWVVSYGHNDLACRLVTFQHDKLLSAMS